MSQSKIRYVLLDEYKYDVLLEFGRSFKKIGTIEFIDDSYLFIIGHRPIDKDSMDHIEVFVKNLNYQHNAFGLNFD